MTKKVKTPEFEGIPKKDRPHQHKVFVHSICDLESDGVWFVNYLTENTVNTADLEDQDLVEFCGSNLSKIQEAFLQHCPDCGHKNDLDTLLKSLMVAAKKLT